jgi:hypothetical protein
MMTATQKKSVKIGLQKIEARQYEGQIIAEFTLAEVKKIVGAEELRICQSARSGKLYMEAIIGGGRHLPDIYCAKSLNIKAPMQVILVENKDGGRVLILTNKKGTGGTPPMTLATV